MARWPHSDEDLRAMYAGGRGNTTARRFAHFWAAVQGAGLLPRRWVTLEVAGRRTGRVTRFPVGMADWDGNWYVVSMLGNDLATSDGIWTCGKDGQSVPVGVGCPTIKIDRITVGGTKIG